MTASHEEEEEIQAVCKGFWYKFIPKGEYIFEEGSKDIEYLYFVIKGKVGVYIKTPM